MKQLQWKISVTILLALAICSCRQVRYVAVESSDSTRVEIVRETVTKIDTVLVELPSQSAERTTTDSVSRLETDLAESWAAITPEGLLWHTLRNKPQLLPVAVPSTVERRDSVIYRKEVEQVPVMVEPQLTKWQQLRLRWFWAVTAVALGLAIYTFRKPLASTIRKLL